METRDAPVSARLILEVCVDTIPDAVTAAASGADRIELCSALELGGVTPSPGSMRAAKSLSRPVSVMIRPRGGDFFYGPAEIDVMRRDIDAVRREGLGGVVLGAHTASGGLDPKALKLLLSAAAGLNVTLHRAFDLVPDLTDALETAIDLGFTRILTSGGQATASQGAEAISRLITQAGGRIIVMPGAGITPANAQSIVSVTGAAEIHGSCSLPEIPNESSLTPDGPPRRRTSADIVRTLRRELDRIEDAARAAPLRP